MGGMLTKKVCSDNINDSVADWFLYTIFEFFL